MTRLDACGCCARSPTLRRPANAPGQPALRYRLATQPEFLRGAIDRLARERLPDGARPLAALTTRDPADPALALLDAWATTADVLAFYQERIANENYLRTATERRSVLELARALGYELSPGVAASAHLAFTVETAKGAPRTSAAPAGTRVQSVPAPGRLPQTFESSQALVARGDRNALAPLRAHPQAATTTTTPLYFEGVATRLKPGDLLLLVSGATAVGRRVLAVRPDAERGRTRVDLGPDPSGTSTEPPAYAPPKLPQGEPTLAPLPLDAAAVETKVLGASWREDDLQALLRIQQWDADALLDAVASAKAQPPALRAFALRARVGFFGHNAPPSASLQPVEAYDPDWDGLNSGQGPDVWRDAQGTLYRSAEGADVFLERVVQEVVEGSWIWLEGRRAAGARSGRAFQVEDVSEASLAEFGVGGKATGLTLRRPGGGEPDVSERFLTRKTTAFVQSEELTLARTPLEDEVSAKAERLTLDRMVLGLAPGQPVALKGERADLAGVVETEILLLKDVVHEGGHTTLVFDEPLRRAYLRASVAINANVVPATHGETVAETLGSGDARAPHQRFALSRPPLTYVSAANPKGRASSLVVRVDGVRWTETPSFYGRGPDERVYVVRVSDEGKASVRFGDGVRGARLPTGRENVTATYRTGIGLEGEVAAGSLSLLPQRPLGMKDVTNPLAASGAADPETLADARGNAPATVLTLDRVVSLRDFEDFARAFPGVGKALAAELWDGETRLVHLTVAGVDGATLPSGSPLLGNLLGALASAADPGPQVRASGYRRVYFNVEAGLVLDPDRVAEDVLDAAQAALRRAFGFAARRFAAPVSAAEVVTALQRVPGVVAVDLDALYRVEDPDAAPPPTLDAVLPCAGPTMEGHDATPAELLLLHPLGGKLTRKGVAP